MQRRGAAFRAAFVCALLASCQAMEAPADIDLDGKIWEVGSARFITQAELVSRLHDVRYRLLGEVHDNAQHHRLRAALITSVAATGVRPAVVFELFDLAHDAALVAAQSAGANADQLASAGALDRRAWQWPLHRPLIAAALDAHLPVRASNIARADLMRVARAGATALPIAPWRERFQNAHWGSDEEAALRSDIVEAHCNALPAAAVPGLLLAQRVRDAVMAQALVDAATADGAILVAGNGHVRKDLGVPVYLEASHNRDTTVASVSVGFVEVSDTERRAADFPHNAVPSPRSFDYVWFTSPASRDDPCAALRPSTH